MPVSLNIDDAHALESIFNQFNISLFNRSLPTPKLTLCHLSKTNAQFIRDGWRHPATGQTYHELQLNQELVNNGKRDVCEHLVHLMVHLFQYTHGQKKPTSHDHNVEFVTIMKNIGFDSEATHGRSLEFTPIVGGKFMQALSTIPELTVLRPVNSSALLDNEDAKSKSKSGVRAKWGCPNGHGTARASKDPDCVCATCDMKWVKLAEK